MVLEFSPKCQTSQAEDFLRILLANPNSDVATSNEEVLYNVRRSQSSPERHIFKLVNILGNFMTAQK